MATGVSYPSEIGGPSGDLSSRLIEIEEQGLVEKVVAHAVVEAFDEAVLHRLAWRDEGPVGLDMLALSQHGLAGKLGAVVADDRVRLAALLDDRRHLPRHALARDRVSGIAPRHSW